MQSRSAAPRNALSVWLRSRFCEAGMTNAATRRDTRSHISIGEITIHGMPNWSEGHIAETIGEERVGVTAMWDRAAFAQCLNFFPDRRDRSTVK